MAGVDSIGFAQVPTTGLNHIDLSSSDIQRSASLLKQACSDSGFFYVINHGLSPQLMEEVFDQSRRFFSLPLSQKMKLLRNEKNRGYSPLFDQVLDAANQKKVVSYDSSIRLLKSLLLKADVNKYQSTDTSEERLSSTHSRFTGDYREGYFLGVEVAEEDPDAQRPHFGPNVAF
ncbi:uncharacterized protein J3R85_018370 [Psidium guajava]|nr:uncharacterized protein J3R85_018370 [Psidium guajava]